MNRIDIGDYVLSPIGKVELGVDGWDAYYDVTNPDGDLDHDELHNLAQQEFWYETRQEAGGYFCKSVSVYMNTLYDKNDKENRPWNLILVVHHRYDV
jgi:hypothetical protein